MSDHQPEADGTASREVGALSDYDPGPPEQPDIPEDEYRRGLQEALIRLGLTAHTLCNMSSPIDPTPGSPADLALADEAQWVVPDVNPAPIREAFQNIWLAIDSGHDHVGSLGLSLMMRRKMGTSLITIIRGALEAYGRAHLLMGDLSVRSVMVGHLASRRSVLDQAVIVRRGPDGTRTPTPYNIESTRMMDRVKVLAEAWGFTWDEIAPTKYGASVQRVLDAYAQASGLEIPSGIYGVLSETAHAETVGFRLFMKVRDELNEHGQETAVPGLNYEYLNALVQILLGVHVEVVRMYLTLSGQDDEDIHALWTESVEWCHEVGRGIHEDMHPDETSPADDASSPVTSDGPLPS
jgi:hypothetical protein